MTESCPSSIWEIDLKSDGGLQKLECFLQQGGSPDEIRYPRVSNHRGTFLIEAAFLDHMEAVKALVSHGADLDYVHYLGGTALTIAAGRGNLEMCRLLLNHGANVNILRTATVIPSILNFPSIQSVEETALYKAAKNGHSHVINLLVEYGAETDIIVCSIPVLGDVLTPLSIASRQGYFETVKALVEGGADVNFMHPVGFSALHEAIVNSHLDVFNLLVKSGADIHQRGSFHGATPLWLAREIGWKRPSKANREIQTYLKQQGGIARVSWWVAVLMVSWMLGSIWLMQLRVTN